MNTNELTPEQQAELDDKIFAAKKRAERAGYKVIMPGEAGNTAPRHTMSRQAFAQRAGGPANRLSTAGQLSQLAQAARTAENAGYKVRKATQAAQQTSPAEPEKKPNPYFAAAARFCKQED